MAVALITGASAGFGRAVARELAGRGWDLIVDARTEGPLRRVANETRALAVPGDVADPFHRTKLARAVEIVGRLDLLVNNASYLGPSPQPRLEDYPLAELKRVYEVGVFAPLALTQLLMPLLKASDGIVVNVTSDAGAEAYPGWGGYGSAKAALDHVSKVLGAEHECVDVYAFDPGDMRTAMHQAAFPDEDISDRPEPETVVPAFMHLLERRPPSGRYRAADLEAVTA